MPALLLAASLLLPVESIAAETATATATSSGPDAPSALTNLGAAIMSAVVEQNGQLIRGSGIQRLRRETTESNYGAGRYQLLFNRDIRSCSYSVTPAPIFNFIRYPGAPPQLEFGNAYVRIDPRFPNGILVDIIHGGAFFVIVFCAQ